MSSGQATRAFSQAIRARAGPPVAKFSFPDIAKIVPVASGKGGVGKSATAVNLAVALAAQHSLHVGLLDADVQGPSVHKMLSLSGRPALDPDGRMVPPVAHGVRCMSTGLLMEESKAAAWRGPMVMSALETLLRKVAWGKLDILLVDMPPGTGDVQLTLTQRLNLTGAVIVTTPQDIALIDARRGISLFREVGVPILGLVENMSGFVCRSCGAREHVFGRGGAARAAAEAGAPVLGEVPLLTDIQEASDAGIPVVARAPDSPAGRAYAGIADAVYGALWGPGSKQ